MRRPSFCLDVRFGLSKITSQSIIDEIAGLFLLACNFTDAWLPALIRYVFLGKGFVAFPVFGRSVLPRYAEVRGKSETSEHNPIFANKTAGLGGLKHGSGRPSLFI